MFCFSSYQVSAADIKKVKMSVESLHSEKVKMEKTNAKKPAAKGKGKVSLRTENDVSVQRIDWKLRTYG